MKFILCLVIFQISPVALILSSEQEISGALWGRRGKLRAPEQYTKEYSRDYCSDLIQKSRQTKTSIPLFVSFVLATVLLSFFYYDHYEVQFVIAKNPTNIASLFASLNKVIGIVIIIIAVVTLL